MTNNKNISESKWYIVRSIANREKKISELLQMESDRDMIKGIEKILVPIENKFYMRSGKKVKREAIMFPGYIFIKTSAPAELKARIGRIDGAIGMLTNRSGDIEVLSQRDVDRMIGVQEEAKEREVVNPYVMGERVRIIDGAFSSMLGTVESINSEKVELSVMIFSRETKVELNIYQIEKE